MSEDGEIVEVMKRLELNGAVLATRNIAHSFSTGVASCQLSAAPNSFTEELSIAKKHLSLCMYSTEGIGLQTGSARALLTSMCRNYYYSIVGACGLLESKRSHRCRLRRHLLVLGTESLPLAVDTGLLTGGEVVEAVAENES